VAAAKDEKKRDPMDYKELLASLEPGLAESDSMKKLLVMAKQEVERTKELQVAFLTGVMCFCAFVMLVFYTPKAYNSFLEWRRSV